MRAERAAGSANKRARATCTNGSGRGEAYCRRAGADTGGRGGGN